MIRTVELSPYIQVQGVVTATLPGGNLAVQTDGREFIGRALSDLGDVDIQA